MPVLALLYHDIVKREERGFSGFRGADADIYKLDPDEFRRHLEAIRRVKSVHIRPEGNATSKAFEQVRITFDDGGSSALHAADLLEEFGWRGHFFIVTDMIGKPEFLTESQITGLHRRGHTVGSHSCSHPARMWSCTVEQLRYEWSESVRRLSQIVQAEVTMASVPSGFYSHAVGAEASRAGIRTLFTSEPVTATRRVEDCAVLGRFSVQEGVSSEWVSSLVAGRAWPRYQRYLYWNGKKVLKRMGGTVWLRVRRNIIDKRAATLPS